MRRLVCIAGEGTRVIAPIAGISVTLPSGESYEILEGFIGTTPLNQQGTHVSESTARDLVHMHPAHWQIVDQREIDELKRICG